MTPKNEKRIFVQEIIICRKPKSKDIYKCSCFNNPFSGYLVCRAHPDYKEGITRAEAVERIAKALLLKMFKGIVDWEKLDDKEKVRWRKSAEAALDALLGGDNV